VTAALATRKSENAPAPAPIVHMTDPVLTPPPVTAPAIAPPPKAAPPVVPVPPNLEPVRRVNPVRVRSGSILKLDIDKRDD